MAANRAPERAKSDHVFGRARKPEKMLGAGLYARVSTNDHQTIPLRVGVLREYCPTRLAIALLPLQVKEVGIGASELQLRENLRSVRRDPAITILNPGGDFSKVGD